MSADLWAEILRAALRHLFLVAVASGIAILVGVPLGIWLARRAALRTPLLTVVNVIQTIPSLALFGLLLPIPIIGGIGPASALTALTLYALLPVVRNTLAGLLSVDARLTDAATAMGANPRQLLQLVELPLAGRTILAGVRTAVVTTVGTATIAAAIGAGGLGELIFRGVASVDTGLLIAGSVPAAVMALLADAGLGWLERRTTWRSEA